MTWCNENYGYRKIITIDLSQVAGDETNFPILVSITNNSLRDTANGGHVENSNGYDIVFYSSTCTLLKHEIERYVNTSGTLDYWVRIPSLSSTVTQTIHMYYGRVGVVDDPSSTDVWDANFLGVYHMLDESGDCHDSTSNANDGTYAGSLPSRIIGSKCGWAQDFDGASDTINLPIECHTPEQGTYEITFKSKESEANMRMWEAGDEGDYRHQFDLRWDVGRHDMKVKYTAAQEWNDTDPTDPDTDDHYVALSFETGDQDWYMDTVLIGSGTITTDTFDYDNFYIGSCSNGTSCWFYGEISEVRISDIKRSANWLETTHNTQMNAGTFLSFGNEEENPEEPPEPPTPTGFALTSTTTVVRLNMPEWDGEERVVNKNIDIINFWTDDLETIDKNKASEPLTLTGVETGSCVTTPSIASRFSDIWGIQNRHEEVTISGLGSCMNGVYIIKNFHFETIPGVITAFRWSMVLEFVRA